MDGGCHGETGQVCVALLALLRCAISRKPSNEGDFSLSFPTIFLLSRAHTITCENCSGPLSQIKSALPGSWRKNLRWIKLRKRKGFIASCLIIALLGAMVVPAASAGTGSSTKLILPQGERLSEVEQEEVEGKGLAGAVWGAAAVGFGGLVGYSVGVAWDIYVDGEDASWEASDASKAVAVGAATGFVAGLLTPTP